MTQERNLSDIEQEMFNVQERIDEVSKTRSALNKEFVELNDKLHVLKEKKFEISHNIKKGDIILDTDGCQYYYQGFSKEWGWGNNFFLVNKMTKSGKPSKNTMHVLCSKFDLETKSLSN